MEFAYNHNFIFVNNMLLEFNYNYSKLLIMVIAITDIIDKFSVISINMKPILFETI